MGSNPGSPDVSTCLFDAVTLTVTSTDGSRTRAYRLQGRMPPACAPSGVIAR